MNWQKILITLVQGRFITSSNVNYIDTLRFSIDEIEEVSNVEKSRKDPIKIVERILQEDRKVLEKLNTDPAKAIKLNDKFIKKKHSFIRRGT